ncbi:VPS45 [Candida margitis]|uniref:VPS45 n=1 Tax=Candida margitis TaxID=1775924 RepID=UPI0022266571|nr:VPS45 [Candida margitis]KAI5949840.1 VPS45 [Candida margitis]
MSLSLFKVKQTYFEKLFKSNANSDPNSNSNSSSSSSNHANKKVPKVLLLDNITTSIISLSYTQSQLLSNDIILIELIENHKRLSTMKHLDCIVYINPNSASINQLLDEMKSPHFRKYRVFFNNVAGKNDIEQLAVADEYDGIDQVLEIFQDYYILNDELYLNKSLSMRKSVNPVLEQAKSLTSLLLALKKSPIIMYESNSIDLKKLSSELLYIINSNSNNNLFDDLNQRSDTPPVLLLLDRKNDPITPLLTPWTYQSMIHEFLTIDKNVVTLPDNQVILSQQDDSFYNESMYLNYGDLTNKFQKYVEQYKSETKQSSIENLKSQNLAELKKTLTKFPEFKKISVNILTHLNLISGIDEQISKQQLWDIGELQQTIICDLDNQSDIKNKMIQVLENKAISTMNKIKLVLLYSYKFHNPTDLSLFIGKLENETITSPLPNPTQLELMKKFTTLFKSHDSALDSNQDQHEQHQNRQGLSNLFTNRKVNINNLFNRNSTNHSGNDNVYLSYTPRLNQILTNLLNPHGGGATSNQGSNLHPNLSTLYPEVIKQQYGDTSADSIQDLIIYFDGGVTYEELRLVHEFNQENRKINIIIGGDEMLSSDEWLKKMYQMISRTENSNQGHEDGGFAMSTQDRQAQLREIL